MSRFNMYEDIIRPLLVIIVLTFTVIGMCTVESWCQKAIAGTHIAPHQFLHYSTWNTFQNQIKKDKDKEVLLIWSGDGGYCDIGDAWIKFINNQSKTKHITIKVVKEAWSEHAISLCRLNNNIKVIQDGILVFHPGRFDDDKTYVPKSDDRAYNYPCIAKGYLTASDLNKIVNQKLEVWVYPDHHKEYKTENY